MFVETIWSARVSLISIISASPPGRASHPHFYLILRDTGGIKEPRARPSANILRSAGKQSAVPYRGATQRGNLPWFASNRGAGGEVFDAPALGAKRGASFSARRRQR